MHIKDNIKLPRISLFNPYKHEKKIGLLCWNEYYGGINIARKYCRLFFFNQPYSFLWYHGIIGPWENSIDILTYNKLDNNCKYFVTTKEQESVFKSLLYSDVYAIGLPIIYLKQKLISRYPNTLLIMPTHTLFGEKILNKKLMNDFLDLVLSENQLDKKNILVCLHSNDIQNGYWLDELKSRRLHYVMGAQNNDKNAYKRQMFLFSQFETMVTNDFGSHVAYALYFGTKVCIKDMKLETDQSIDSTFNLLSDETKSLVEKRRIEKKKYLNVFYCHINDAIKDVALGEYLVGKSNKISKKEMKRLFGWQHFNLFNKVVKFYHRLHLTMKNQNTFSQHK